MLFHINSISKKVILAVTVGIASVALLSGCGSGVKTQSASSGDGKTHVKAVVSSVEAPRSWKDENNVIHGLDIEVLNAVNTKLKKYHLDVEAVPPETQDVMLESGEAKVGAGYFPTPKREENFLIAKPTSISALVAYVKKEDVNKYGTVEDAVKAGLKMVPATPNGGAFQAVTKWNKDHNNLLKEVPVQSGITIAEQVDKLKTGEGGFLVETVTSGIEEMAQKDGFEVAYIKDPFFVKPQVLLVNKNEKELQAELNQALKELEADGTLSKINVKYFHKDVFKLFGKDVQ